MDIINGMRTLVLFLIAVSVLIPIACKKQDRTIDLMCEGIDKEKDFLQIGKDDPLTKEWEINKIINLHFKDSSFMISEDEYIACQKWDAVNIECEKKINDPNVGFNNFYLRLERSSGRLQTVSKSSTQKSDITRKSEEVYIAKCVKQ